MQPDLIGLEFSKGELRRLTGVDPDAVFRPAIFQNKEKRTSFILNEILICFVISAIIVGIIYTFIILANINSASQLAIALIIVVPLTVAIGRWLWRKKTLPNVLVNLLNEVDKYHAVINKVDANDQVVTEADISRDRNLVIAALQFIREDLVCALKTERSLRTSKNLTATDADINNKLESIAIQSTHPSEYGRMLNEVLQIASSVQEMRKLQRQHSK